MPPTLGDLDACEQWILSVLTANAGVTALSGGAYNSQAPRGMAPPYKVFSLTPRQDGVTMGSKRYEADYEALIVYVTEGDKDAANLGATAIDNAFDDVAADQNGYHFNSHRIMGHTMPQIRDDHTYWRVGGRYLIKVRRIT